MMFALAENENIGRFLRERIDQQGYKSHRQFCREYLKKNGESADPATVTKLANRLSQILKGEKEIQLRDIPLFCQLLEVSCEDILSAGKSHAPALSRLTNYTVAFSRDKREWDEYVTREDSPILNADEYGKTVIDYALKAANYDFLKYLMNKKYIWFVGADEENRFIGFGAGTSIEKAFFPYPRNWNVLDVQLKMRDELRMHMAVLAIQHGDMEMLEQLRAREIPTLYQLSYYSSRPDEYQKYHNEKLMEALDHAENEVLEYFSGEFEITDRVGFVNRFTFPFLGELIESLLQAKNKYAKDMLKSAIRHNQSVYHQLTDLLFDAVKSYKRLGYDLTSAAMQDDLKKGILRDLEFYGDGSLISYFALLPNTKRGLRSNIIQVNAESSDTVISHLIAELNRLYDAIHNITPKFEGGSNDVL